MAFSLWTDNWSADNLKETRHLTDCFVHKQLKDLKVNKATGLDKIPARLLKDSAHVVAPSITHIVNLSLHVIGTVPDEWTKARGVPL